eukprot:1161722-Pelagomonas_calceolata.AAC.8
MLYGHTLHRRALPRHLQQAKATRTYSHGHAYLWPLLRLTQDNNEKVFLLAAAQQTFIFLPASALTFSKHSLGCAMAKRDANQIDM